MKTIPIEDIKAVLELIQVEKLGLKLESPFDQGYRAGLMHVQNTLEVLIKIHERQGEEL